MKAGFLRLLIFGFMLFFYSFSCDACPSCVGKSQRGTPAFFDDELYEHGGNNETNSTFLTGTESYKLDLQLSRMSG